MLLFLIIIAGIVALLFPDTHVSGVHLAIFGIDDALLIAGLSAAASLGSSAMAPDPAKNVGAGGSGANSLGQFQGMVPNLSKTNNAPAKIAQAGMQPRQSMPSMRQPQAGMQQPMGPGGGGGNMDLATMLQAMYQQMAGGGMR